MSGCLAQGKFKCLTVTRFITEKREEDGRWEKETGGDGGSGDEEVAEDRRCFQLTPELSFSLSYFVFKKLVIC